MSEENIFWIEDATPSEIANHFGGKPISDLTKAIRLHGKFSAKKIRYSAVDLIREELQKDTPDWNQVIRDIHNL